MKNDTVFKLTREKHLDHMVKVVPFIVFCYAVQCYFIYKMAPTDFSTTSLSVLGGFLGLMILGFITYDLRHEVTFGEKAMRSHFFYFSHSINYQDILDVEVKDPEESFSTIRIVTRKKSYTYYFIDDSKSVVSWINSKRFPEQNKMAA